MFDTGYSLNLLARLGGNRIYDGIVATPDRNVKKVTSGGQLKRTGNTTVPNPRFVYKVSGPSRLKPLGYLRASGGR